MLAQPSILFERPNRISVMLSALGQVRSGSRRIRRTSLSGEPKSKQRQEYDPCYEGENPGSWLCNARPNH